MKNKKLLAVFAIPLVIAVMVLPLCSFTTVYSSDYERYSSYTNVGIGYAYDYGTSGTYRGVLQNCLSVLVDASANSLAQKNNSIKFTASDYYITSSSRISIVKPSTLGWGDGGPLSIIPNSSQYYGLYDYRCSLAYDTNNPNTYFTGEFWFENYNLDDNIGIDFYSNDAHFNLTGNYTDIRLEFDISYIYEFSIGSSTGVEIKTEHLFGDYSQVYDWPTFYIDEFVYDLIDENSYVPLADMLAYEITNLHFNVMPYVVPAVDTELQPLDGGRLSAISVTGNVINDKENYTSFINILKNIFGNETPYEYGYTLGYDAGYNVGISNAENVWGSFTDFLTTTIGGFLDFHIAPNITVSGILSVILSISLVFLFLRLFAGG